MRFQHCLLGFTVLSLTISLSACTTQQSQTSSEPDELVVRTAKDIGDLNPHTMNSQMYAQDWVYEGLVALEQGEIVPELAESWDISPEGCTYTFHLRDGVQFSDGTLFTSEIAKKNIEAVQQHKDSYSFLQSLNVIESIETPDHNTLVLQLSQPCNSLLNDFTYSRPLAMLGESGFPDTGTPYSNGIKAPVGTGMWILEEYVPNQYASFESNPNYWGQAPSVQELKALVIPDVNTAATALRAGEIDVMVDATQITSELFQQMERDGFGIASAPTTSVTSVYLNTTSPLLQDVIVRKALAYGTDNTEISQGVFGGLQPTASAYFSTEIPYTDVGLPSYSYDSEQANLLLEEAGWLYESGADYRSKNGTILSLDLIYDASVTNDRDIGLVLQAQYAKIGVKLNLLPQDSQVYRQNWTNGAFDLLIYSSWGGSYEPYATLAAMSTSGDKFCTPQLGMAQKKELDLVMQDCLSQTNPTKLQENFQYIMTSFHDEVVYIPLTVVTTLAIYDSDFSAPDLTSAQGGLGISHMTTTHS